MSNKWQVWLTNWPIMKLKKRLHAVWILTRAHYFLGFYICLCIFVLFNLFFSVEKCPLVRFNDAYSTPFLCCRIKYFLREIHLYSVYNASKRVGWMLRGEILFWPRIKVPCFASTMPFLVTLCHMTRTLCAAQCVKIIQNVSFLHACERHLVNL